MCVFFFSESGVLQKANSKLRFSLFPDFKKKYSESFIHSALTKEAFILVHQHFWHRSNLHFYSIINEQESHLHFPLFTVTLCGAYFLFQRPVFGNLDGVKERDRQGERMNNPFCFQIMEHGGQTGVHLSAGSHSHQLALASNAQALIEPFKHPETKLLIHVSYKSIQPLYL